MPEGDTIAAFRSGVTGWPTNFSWARDRATIDPAASMMATSPSGGKVCRLTTSSMTCG